MLIDLTNFCQAFHALPRSGGILDQDCYYMIGMSLVLNSQNAKAKREADAEASKSKGLRNAFRR